MNIFNSTTYNNKPIISNPGKQSYLVYQGIDGKVPQYQKYPEELQLDLKKTMPNIQASDVFEPTTLGFAHTGDSHNITGLMDTPLAFQYQNPGMMVNIPVVEKLATNTAIQLQNITYPDGVRKNLVNLPGEDEKIQNTANILSILDRANTYAVNGELETARELTNVAMNYMQNNVPDLFQRYVNLSRAQQAQPSQKKDEVQEQQVQQQQSPKQPSPKQPSPKKPSPKQPSPKKDEVQEQLKNLKPLVPTSPVKDFGVENKKKEANLQQQKKILSPKDLETMQPKEVKAKVRDLLKSLDEQYNVENRDQATIDRIEKLINKIIKKSKLSNDEKKEEDDNLAQLIEKYNPQGLPLSLNISSPPSISDEEMPDEADSQNSQGGFTFTNYRQPATKDAIKTAYFNTIEKLNDEKLTDAYIQEQMKAFKKPDSDSVSKLYYYRIKAAGKLLENPNTSISNYLKVEIPEEQAAQRKFLRDQIQMLDKYIKS